MIGRSWVLSLLVVAAAGWESGCRHRAPVPESDWTALPDSMTGVLSITGTSFESQFVLRMGELVLPLRSSGADSSALTRVGNTKIRVRGTMSAGAFVVQSFVVLSVNSELASDGTLHRDGTHLILRRANGDAPLGNPPPALDSLVGARIWISGPLDTGPNSYGVIEPPR